MTSSTNFDFLFLIDASDRMKHCFQNLRDRLHRFCEPLKQAHVEIRYGLLAYNAETDGHTAIYRHTFVGGNDPVLVKDLYSPRMDPDKYFTRDVDTFLRALDSVLPQGDENWPLALDIAADFPFSDIAESHRVIAFFSNGNLDDGIRGSEPSAKFIQVASKICQRRIRLNAYISSRTWTEATEMMCDVPRSVISLVEDGDNYWDLARLEKMVDIRIPMLAVTDPITEPEYQKAIYGQDKFVLYDDRITSGK